MLIAQPVEACTGFIIGKKLTADGSTLVGRTEDLEPNHNKNFVVRERVYNKKEPSLKMLPTVFNIPCLRLAIEYTAVPDVTPDQGILTKQDSTNMGFPFLPLYLLQQMTRSKGGSLCQGWPRRIGLDQYRSPKCENRKRRVELIAKIVEEKGAAEGNIVTIADKEGVWYMEILSGHQYAAILFPEDRFAVFPNTFFLGHVDLSDTERTIASKILKSRQRSQ